MEPLYGVPAGTPNVGETSGPRYTNSMDRYEDLRQHERNVIRQLRGASGKVRALLIIELEYTQNALRNLTSETE